MNNSKPDLIEIRRARVDDAALVSRIAVRTFCETFGALYSEDNLNAFLDKNHRSSVYGALIADPAFAVWIAFKKGVGACGYVVAGPCGLPVTNMPPQSGELMRLYVDTAHQGHRIGAQMLEIALAWLNSRFANIFLSVYAENYGAQRFYARYGFTKVQKYEYMVGRHADPEWIMRAAPIDPSPGDDA